MPGSGVIGVGSATVLDPDATVHLVASSGDARSRGDPGSAPDPPESSLTPRLESPPRHAREVSPESRWAQADILVVDDDQDVRSSMAGVLRSVGYTVVEASDGQSALDILVGTDVSLVVLDLHMAPRDGLWLLEHIEGAPTVVVVSAFAIYDEGTVRSQYAGRVSSFLRKPVSPPRLIESIREGMPPRARP